MENNSLNKDEGILYISFNHDHSCFKIGKDICFKIFIIFNFCLKKKIIKYIK